HPTNPQHTSTPAQPSTEDQIIVPLSSQPKKTQRPRKAIRTTEISQSSGPIPLVADETVTKEWEDRMERAATTASILEAKQDNGSGLKCQDTILGGADAQTRFETPSKQSNDPSLSKFNTLRSGEDRLKLRELMKLCTKLSKRVLDLETTKTGQAKEIANSRKKLKKLERGKKSRTNKLKRLYKIGSSRRVESSEEAINEALNDEDLFGVNDLDGEEVIVDEEVVKPVDEEMTLAQTLIEVKVQDKEEEESLANQREEDTNIAEWDDIQAMMDADYELAARLQAQEKGELTIEEKSKMFVELMDKRKKHFAKLRAKEQRRKPLTKAQKRNQIWIDSFVPMDSELEKGSQDKAKGSDKRTRAALEQEVIKKQKLDDDQETNELKQLMTVIQDEEIAMDAIPLATKSPKIVDWKIYKEGRKSYYQIIRADGKSQMYRIFSQML
ncbi:hypothetical protein Tco_0017856, partial [Tanacetum coccineum]